MATYGDTKLEYPYSPQKKKKQKYNMITRVVDFTKLPTTSGTFGKSGGATTAFGAADVLQTIYIRAGVTVLGVQIEILKTSNDSGDFITIGYGGEAARWGKVWLWQIARGSGGMLQQPNDTLTNLASNVIESTSGWFGNPYYFTSADTIDITIGKASLTGKIRLIVHTLEDDR